GHQPFADDLALGVERQTAFGDQVVVLALDLLDMAVQLLIAERAFGEADDRPRPVPGRQPEIEPFLTGHILVAEVEPQADAAGGGRRLELDIGDALLTLDLPYGARALQAGELPPLLRVGLDRRIIRRRD